MLFKHLRSMLLVIGVGLLFVISNNQSVLAEGKSVNEDFIDPKVDEVNTKLLELDEKLHELFGEKATISSLGYMTVDEKGIIQVNLKNNFKETAKAIYSSENESNEMIEWMKSQGIVVNNTAKYSSDELTNISDRVMADITSYYNFDLPKDFTLAVEPDVEKQIIRLKYDFSDKSAPENDLLKQLEIKYSNILVTEDTKYENVEFTKSKNGDWNNLGGGLAISSSPSGPRCTTTALLHKNSNYFLLTAGHCFEGAVSTTAGAYQYQYSKIVGRQHSTGLWNNIDAGIIRFEGNNLAGGRYATNGVKIAPGSGTIEDFDNTFVNWSEPPSVVYLESICKSGVSTDKTCGGVKSGTSNVIIKGQVVKVFRSDLYAVGGDSGGPVYKPSTSGNVLVGLVTGGGLENGKNVSFITKVLDIRDMYDINLYTTNSNTKVAN